jgi:hypothetical protein
MENMTNTKTLAINDIESLTFNEAAEIALDYINIKDHDILFVDFGGYFGYSALVFKNEKHIYYANEYELHHKYLVKEQGKSALKDHYCKELNKKLFTEVELMSVVKSYDDYTTKSYYLRNYWIMQFDRLSCFGIGKQWEKEFEEKNKIYKYFCPACFCYVKNNEIVKRANKILEHLQGEFDKIKSSDEVFREMISTELVNHEACITCDYEPALAALNMSIKDLTENQIKIMQEELHKQIEYYNA